MYPSAVQVDICFSASASFATYAFLLVIGRLTWKGVRVPNERAFAAIPSLFALQQFIEGGIWLTLSRDAPLTNEVMTYSFSFFSLLLWPVYSPVAVLLIDPQGWRRQCLGVFVAAGAIASGLLLYIVAGYGVVSRVTGHHIDYVMPHLFPLATMMLCLLSTGVSELLSTYVKVKIFGLLVLLSFGAAYVAYPHWFISIWCYFAALLSVFVLFHFNRLPNTPKHSPTAQIKGLEEGNRRLKKMYTEERLNVEIFSKAMRKKWWRHLDGGWSLMCKYLCVQRRFS